MYEAWQGGNLYIPAVQETGGFNGNINIPLPGGGSVDIGGDWGSNPTPPPYTGGGTMPPPYIGGGAGNNPLGGLFQNPMMLIILFLILFLALRK